MSLKILKKIKNINKILKINNQRTEYLIRILAKLPIYKDLEKKMAVSKQ